MGPGLRTALASLCVLVVAAGDGTAQRGGFDQRLERAKALVAAEAWEELEALLAEAKRRSERESVLRALADLSPRAAPELNALERAKVDGALERSAPASALLAGRYAVALATEDFAREAREEGLLGRIDVAYLELCDLFGSDPVRARGERYVLYPDWAREEGVAVRPGTMEIAIGRSIASDGSWRDDFVREMAHAFVELSGAEVLFQAGFRRGWPELCQAYAADRLAFLAPKGLGQVGTWRRAFLEAAAREYLDTRLPVEEIPPRGAPSALLMELCLSGAGPGPDWSPLRALLDPGDPPPWTPRWLGPAHLALLLEEAFGGERARPLLARWRFPLDEGARRGVRASIAASAREEPPPFPGEDGDGVRVVRGWRVLGPIPDPLGRGIDFDPLDALNFELRESYSADGESYVWREDAAPDERGLVHLESGEGPAVFYLLAQWPEDERPPVSFSIACGGASALFLDGARIHLRRDGGAGDPADPDRAYGRGRARGGRILVQVAGAGAIPFHLRASPHSPFAEEYARGMRSTDAAEREALVGYLGSRRVPDELVLELLFDGLFDRAAAVRAASARALAARRDDPEVLERLIDRWSREREEVVAAALRDAVDEQVFRRFETWGEAKRWLRDAGRARQRWHHVECELALPRRALSDRATTPGAYGGLCVGRGFGRDPGDRLWLALEVRGEQPKTFALRYACPAEDAGISLRLWRGERAVHEIRDLDLPPTRDWDAWAWREVGLPALPPGWYRLELFAPSGEPALDVAGLRE